MKRSAFITASEIGEFVYCKRVWWLRLNRLLPSSTPETLRGIAAHEAVSTQLQDNNTRTYLSYVLIVVGVILLSIALLYMVFIT